MDKDVDAWIPIKWERADQSPNLHAISINRMVSPLYSGTRYAVRKNHLVLSQISLKFYYEPLSSAKDDKFFDEFRFRTWSSAGYSAADIADLRRRDVI